MKMSAQVCRLFENEPYCMTGDWRPWRSVHVSFISKSTPGVLPPPSSLSRILPCLEISAPEDNFKAGLLLMG